MPRQDFQEIVDRIKLSDGDEIVIYDFLSPDWTTIFGVNGDKSYLLAADMADNFELVGLDAIGNVEFGDPIFLINGLGDPFSVKEGLNLRVPPSQSILDFQAACLSGNPPRLRDYPNS